MRSGSLRHRIAVDEPIATRTAGGAESITWECVGNAWASIEPIRGREALIGEQVLADMDTRIKVRWSKSLDRMTEKWRLRHEGRIYNIKQVAHIALRRREIEIMASSGLNNG